MTRKLTPLMSQYREIKNRYMDGILFFQVGDFYETFYSDAEDVSKILNIALTTRDKGKKNPIPLAGVPIHAAETYIAKLLNAGKKVVICDQEETTHEVKGLAKRKVTDVITPGTTMFPGTLAESENNFILCVIPVEDRCGFTLLDISTGEFLAGEEDNRAVENIISGFKVREVMLPELSGRYLNTITDLFPECSTVEAPIHLMADGEGARILKEHFKLENLSCFGLNDKPLAESAAGALLGYVKELRNNELKHITRLSLLVSEDTLFLDNETLRNLEIFEPIRGNSAETTLIHHIDRTRTAGGARELRRWIGSPSRNVKSIRKRLDGLGAFHSDQILMRDLRKKLQRFPDIERLISRITAGKATPREILSLGEAMERIPGFNQSISGVNADIILELKDDLHVPEEVKDLIESSIEPSCPSHIRDGGIIRKGFDDSLDTLIDKAEKGRKWIVDLQNSERERTGISSLKVGYNKVFGYYIEVSRIHENKVPEEYIGKQTLVTSQRYVTKELKEREQSIISAESKRIDLEKEIFKGICERISKSSGELQRIARSVSVLDVLSSFAELALDNNYCRPEVVDSKDLVITEGRHPVVEKISSRNFIPNDIVLRPGEKQILIITGPNMGGKSTYIRQSALIAILAHAGSYVPASRARIGVIDRIFTRVGSSDNLAKGESTFLVEMSETAKILHNCTSRSLVLLDEVGRGTSTLDGLSLAWAVTEYLLRDDSRRPKTLFATHYHELTHLADSFPRVQNVRVGIKEWGNRIIFLYKILNGASDKSYGIHVASLAGIPKDVINRAYEILDHLETNENKSDKIPRHRAEQTNLFGAPDPLKQRLDVIDINKITPLEAMKILSELKDISSDK